MMVMMWDRALCVAACVVLYTRATDASAQSYEAVEAVPMMEIMYPDDKQVLALDGSASKGDIVSYRWKLLNSKDKGLTFPTKRAFYETEVNGELEWKLTVCDGDGNCDEETIRTIDNRDFKLPQKLEVNYPLLIAQNRMSSTGTHFIMTLDASSSIDPAGIKYYNWRMMEGDKPGIGFSQALVVYETEVGGDYQWRCKVCNVMDQCSERYYDFHFNNFTPAYNPVG